MSRSVDLGAGVFLELVRIGPGGFVLGQDDGAADERPARRVEIASGFWMGRCEVTNEQFSRFDPDHDSGLEHGDYIQFSPGERGWTLALPRQPVARVSWQSAQSFCRWLSERTGREFRLPTETEWEYACRAGTASPLWFGSCGSDFSQSANVADRTHQSIDPFGWAARGEVIPPWRPADARFDDGARVSAPVGSYRPNPWGLFDMHGNVAEWTSSAYRPYPYLSDDGPERPEPGEYITVRGGSWGDRPVLCRSASRRSHPPGQRIHDVGFRVLGEVFGD